MPAQAAGDRAGGFARRCGAESKDRVTAAIANSGLPGAVADNRQSCRGLEEGGAEFRSSDCCGNDCGRSGR
jgi:hypothetical protein